MRPMSDAGRKRDVLLCPAQGARLARATPPKEPGAVPPDGKGAAGGYGRKVFLRSLSGR